jgi:hypothetical protein
MPWVYKRKWPRGMRILAAVTMGAAPLALAAGWVAAGWHHERSEHAWWLRAQQVCPEGSYAARAYPNPAAPDDVVIVCRKFVTGTSL